jgi:uncharacterized protein (TIGR02996 family)
MRRFEGNCDHAALVAGIIAHPDDTLRRLVYADWVEERGEEGRAAFIRVQCELERLRTEAAPTRTQKTGGPRCRHVTPERCGRCRDLIKLEGELWAHSGAWFPGVSASLPNIRAAASAAALVVRGGFISEARAELVWWMGGDCPECENGFVPCTECDEDGYRRDGWGMNWCHECDGPGSSRTMVCPACKSAARTPEHGPHVVRQHPIRKLTLTDSWVTHCVRHPAHDGNGSNDDEDWFLVSDVWHIGSGLNARFETETDAREALEENCLAWARASLAPTPGKESL